MSTSEKTVADLITEIDEGRLAPKPFFQRRLVWTSRDKEYFIETVLKDMPCPEVFVSTERVDDKHRMKRWLVDGQQRITTLHGYVRGELDVPYKMIPAFDKLEPDQRERVLAYKISVRDLGKVTDADIRDIFKRINSTDYALNKIEIQNAMYSGVYKRYCIELSEHDFFIRHKVFSKGVGKRMGDVTFCVILVTTLQCGYYRRDENNEEYLKRYNDEFPDKEKVQAELERLFDFLDRAALPEKSRAWKQTDLFTLLVELHAALVTKGLPLAPAAVGPALAAFYDQVDAVFADPKVGHGATVPVDRGDVQKYLKAGTKATNDKYARIERAEVIAKILLAAAPADESEGDTKSPAKPAGRRKKKAE